MKVLCCIVFVISLAWTSPSQARHRHLKHRHHITQVGGAEIVPHPSGCPRRNFCACGASLYIFGRIRDDLMAAAAWFKFPKANPAPRMAAVRQHHVFVLEYQIHDDVWMAYDANSGGHLTRRHPRSIRGYTIVNPTTRWSDDGFFAFMA